MNSEAFQLAFARTMKHEGGFSHDPADPGGMTYQGISRVHFPEWQGWEIVDRLLQGSSTPAFSNQPELAEMVRKFYELEFWTRIQGDFISSLSKDSVEIAAELFDTAVNLGRRRAIEILQSALNLLNRNGLAYPDICEDGRMGYQTAAALAQYVERRGFEVGALVKLMNHLQGWHYINLMRKYPDKERFVGWFART